VVGREVDNGFVAAGAIASCAANWGIWIAAGAVTVISSAIGVSVVAILDRCGSFLCGAGSIVVEGSANSEVVAGDVAVIVGPSPTAAAAEHVVGADGSCGTELAATA
jgi:hypothetical protein